MGLLQGKQVAQGSAGRTQGPLYLSHRKVPGLRMPL